MKSRNKKTGEIVETDYKLGVSIPTDSFMGCKSYDQIAEYDSLAKFNEEWEDVRAPLITTNRVRELLKNWADYNDIDEVDVSKDSETGLVSFYNGYTYIDFYVHEPFVKEGEHYTIAELCEGT